MSRIPQYKPDDFKPILDIDWNAKSTEKEELNDFFIEPLQELKDTKTPSQPHRKTVNDFVFIKKGSIEKMVCSSLFEVQEGMIMLLPPYKIRTFILHPTSKDFTATFLMNLLQMGPASNIFRIY